MGCRLVALIKESTTLTLAGAIEEKGHRAVGDDAGETAGCGRVGIPITDDFAALLDRGEVVVDFSDPEATLRSCTHGGATSTSHGDRHDGVFRSPDRRAEIAGVPSSLRVVPQHERGYQSDLQGHQRDGKNAGETTTTLK